MHHNSVLQEVKQNLVRNLWHIINREPIEYFKFSVFLEKILLMSNKTIIAHNIKFLAKYVMKLTYEYAKLMDYVHQNALIGNIIEDVSFIKKSVNGNFTNIIKNFLEDYDKECQ